MSNFTAVYELLQNTEVLMDNSDHSDQQWAVKPHNVIIWYSQSFIIKVQTQREVSRLGLLVWSHPQKVLAVYYICISTLIIMVCVELFY